MSARVGEKPVGAQSDETIWTLEEFQVDNRLFLKFPCPDTSKMVGPDYFVYSGHKPDVESDVLVPIHRHDYFELAWLAEGTAVLFHDFLQFPLKAGTLTFILPGRVHTWISNWATTRLSVVGMKPELLAQIRNAAGLESKLPFDDPTARPFILTSGTHFEAIDRAINLLLWRCRRKLKPQDQVPIAAYIGVVLAEARLAWSEAQMAAEHRPVSARVALTDSFRLKVEQHHLERLQVKEYADMLGVSPHYLISAVSESAGTSPKQIIDDRLALEACRLLGHTHATIGEIAFSLSFNSSSQFSRWFKTREGASPTQFRKKWAARQILTTPR